MSCVRGDIGTTKYLNCSKSLQRGCILSPILFSYIIKVVTNEACRHGGHAIQLHTDIIELSILLFVDDIVLIADTVYGMQCKIIYLYNVHVSLAWKYMQANQTLLCLVMEVTWLQTKNGISVQLILTLCRNIHIWVLSCQLA